MSAPSGSPFISAILLAAGESRRMGRQKVLLPYRGKTVIEHILAQVLGIADEVIVVLGHLPEPVAEVLKPYPVKLAMNARYQDGMISSVRAGMAATAGNADAFLLLLGDQPQVQRGLIENMAGHYRTHPGGILLPEHGGRPGHPPIISLEYREVILRDFEETGLRGLYQRYPESITLLPAADPGIHEDLDTPEDYARLQAQEHRGPRHPA